MTSSYPRPMLRLHDQHREFAVATRTAESELFSGYAAKVERVTASGKRELAALVTTTAVAVEVATKLNEALDLLKDAAQMIHEDRERAAELRRERRAVS